MPSIETVKFNLRFPGQYYDEITKQHYNLNRYYNPEIGRYMEADPIGLEGGLNPYAYAGSNPVMNSDPTGLVFISDNGYTINDYPNFDMNYLSNLQMSFERASSNYLTKIENQNILALDFLGKNLAHDYLDRYNGNGGSAWSAIRNDRNSNVPVIIGSNSGSSSEAMRNAEHYLYQYSEVQNNSYNWGLAHVLTVGYHTTKFWANTAEYYNLLNSPYTYTIPTSDELISGFEGANEALFGIEKCKVQKNC
jgi:RHS repeat-associated protein